MPLTDSLRDAELLIRSRHGLLVIETHEEERAEALFRHLADRMKLPLFAWSLTRGIRRVDEAPPPPSEPGPLSFDRRIPLEAFASRGAPGNAIYETAKPIQALQHLHSAELPALYHFRALGPHLGDTHVAEKLLDVVRIFETREGAILLTGGDIELPAAVRPRSATIRLPDPRPEEYRELLRQIVRDLSVRTRVEFELSREELAQLLSALQGLTLLEAEKVLTKAIIEDGKIGPEDIRSVIDAKVSIVQREGLLEYYPSEQTMGDVAGIRTLRRWLEQRRSIFAEPQRAREFGLSFPRGILLVGVPGCGKSLCAKAVGSEWGLPVLKLDPGSLYNKYIGESEKNFRRAMRTAERVAPAVLWIDEIEKAFSSGGGEDGGVSQRVLGTFLSWMQDRAGDVFVVATANDVSKLPAEMLRKGRFDEIFFVDLPDGEARRAIWEIHLRRRGHGAAALDLDRLAAAADGFSGAEIEQALVSGLYAAFGAGGVLTDELLLAEIAGTRPLSHTMEERVRAIREWALERTVPAN
jgi:hypothetical protein